MQNTYADKLANATVSRDWLIAAAKASNAILEAIAADKISLWYALQGRRVHINWNPASDIGTKQEYDLVDTYGTRWEVKSDRIAPETQQVFIEESWYTKSKAEMACIFVSPFAYILPRSVLLELPSIGHAQGGDFNLARGHFVSLEALHNAADAI